MTNLKIGDLLRCVNGDERRGVKTGDIVMIKEISDHRDYAIISKVLVLRTNKISNYSAFTKNLCLHYNSQGKRYERFT